MIDTLARAADKLQQVHDMLRSVTSKATVEGIWDNFSERFRIPQTCVPLFATDDGGCVETKLIGRDNRRPILKRSEPMESMILAVSQQLIADHGEVNRRYDGMLYMMGWKEAGRFIPLYVGKSETVGRNGNNVLSANLLGLRSDKTKFARWGDNYEYHIGELSAWVLPGHEKHKKKANYQRWAQTLFEPGTTRLRRATYFWATAWKPSDIGVWEELGPTTLAVLEYLVIGVAGKISPNLLNRDGIPRQLLF